MNHTLLINLLITVFFLLLVTLCLLVLYKKKKNKTNQKTVDTLQKMIELTKMNDKKKISPIKIRSTPLKTIFQSNSNMCKHE